MLFRFSGICEKRMRLARLFLLVAVRSVEIPYSQTREGKYLTRYCTFLHRHEGTCIKHFKRLELEKMEKSKPIDN